MTKAGRRERRDSGFTLTEMLIAVVVIGLLATTIAGVVTVALRTTPPAEARAEDARSLQGLVTWLPEDVDAAPPGGFNRDVNDWPCSGTAPSTSFNVLSIRWSEFNGVTTHTYAASYRYEQRGARWSIVRYFCEDSNPAVRNNLTGELLPWTTVDPPAYVVMCKVAVASTWANNGQCPTADTWDAGVLAPPADPGVRSMKIIVEMANGTEITIDAAPKNPDEDLADDPDATANQKPTATSVSFTVDVMQGTTTDIDLLGYLGSVDDPDGPESALTISIDPSAPAPHPGYITAATAYTALIQFQLTLTAASNTPLADAPLHLILSDERGGWIEITANLHVVPATNLAPTPSVTVPMLVQDNSTSTIANVLNTSTYSITDPNNDPLTVSVVSQPSGVHTSVDALDTRLVTITTDPSVPSGPAGDIVLHATDPGGLFAVITINLTVAPPASTNQPPTRAQADVPVTIDAGATHVLDLFTPAPAGHGVDDPDLVVGDLLSVAGHTAPAGLAVTVSGMQVTIAADPSLAAQTMAPITVTVSDLGGFTVDVTVTVTITVPPPPPPNCVLGSLVAAPNPVARQGSGVGWRLLSTNVTVTLTYTGSCDGLRLNYDTGDASGLGTGPGRIFPPGSPTSITIFGNGSGGTERFKPGNVVFTASTTTAVTPNTITTTLVVT